MHRRNAEGREFRRVDDPVAFYRGQRRSTGESSEGLIFAKQSRRPDLQFTREESGALLTRMANKDFEVHPSDSYVSIVCRYIHASKATRPIDPNSAGMHRPASFVCSLVCRRRIQFSRVSSSPLWQEDSSCASLHRVICFQFTRGDAAGRTKCFLEAIIWGFNHPDVYLPLS